MKRTAVPLASFVMLAFACGYDDRARAPSASTDHPTTLRGTYEGTLTPHGGPEWDQRPSRLDVVTTGTSPHDLIGGTFTIDGIRYAVRGTGTASPGSHASATHVRLTLSEDETTRGTFAGLVAFGDVHGELTFEDGRKFWVWLPGGQVSKVQPFAARSGME